MTTSVVWRPQFVVCVMLILAGCKSKRDLTEDAGAAPSAMAPSAAQAVASVTASARAAAVQAPPVQSSSPEPIPPTGTFLGKHGETIVVKNDTSVTITIASGSLLSSCMCGQPTPYRAAAVFWTRVQSLVGAGDWAGLSGLINYPVRTPVGVVRDAATFVAQAPTIFSPAILIAIADVEPRAVFCKAGKFMAGDGILWATQDASGHLGLITMNKPLPTPGR